MYLYRKLLLGKSRVCWVMQLRMDGIHFRESAGTGPVLIIVVPVTGAFFSGTVLPWTNQCAPSFSHALYWYEVDMCDCRKYKG